MMGGEERDAVRAGRRSKDSMAGSAVKEHSGHESGDLSVKNTSFWRVFSEISKG